MNDEANLQLMVYDETDIGKRLKELQRLEVLPEGWDLPDIELPLGLTHTWLAGGHAYRALRHVDTFHGFRVWYRALEWLATVHPEQRIQEIQYWGHGSPGRVWMDGEALTIDSFDGEYRDVLMAIRDRLADDALIWFRTCATFGADRGRAFAYRASNFFGCRVAAHTHNVGLFHGGLRTLVPGKEPDWPRDEGIKLGTPEAPKKMKMSGWWWSQPRTITCLNADVPRGW
jgi:hypothetical protein